MCRAGKPSLHNSSVIFVYGQHSKGGLVLATGKRIYWMKLRESFMTSDTVDYLMSLPNGSDYVILYQMLCLKTISTGGRLSRKIGEVVIKYDVPKIQRDLKWFSADTIRTALECFKSLGLVYEEDDGSENPCSIQTSRAASCKWLKTNRCPLPRSGERASSVFTDPAPVWRFHTGMLSAARRRLCCSNSAVLR